MTDPTTAPVAGDTTFDTSTAAGRLRILWSATADPQLAMSADEVADVATVLAEHAAMAAELEQLRAECDETAPVMPDPRGPLHQRVTSDWHAVSGIAHKSWTDDGYVWDLEYGIEHPDECNLLPYGQECLFDRVAALFGFDDGELSFGPRRARAQIYGPDVNGEFEERIEWGADVETTPTCWNEDRSDGHWHQCTLEHLHPGDHSDGMCTWPQTEGVER